MSCGRLTKQVQQRLTAVSTTESQFAWGTEWVPCTGIDDVNVVLGVASMTGDFKARPAYQTASVRTSKPVAATGYGSYRAAEGSSFYTIPLSSVTNEKFFIRFGVEYLISDADIGSADVSLQISYLGKGTPRGTFSKSLVALDEGDNLKQMEILTAWMPTTEVAEFNVAYVVTDADTYFQFRFLYQLAETTIESPSGWTAANSWNTTGNQENNLHDTSVTVGSNMWVRFALEYCCQAEHTNQKAIVSTALTTRL